MSQSRKKSASWRLMVSFHLLATASRRMPSACAASTALSADESTGTPQRSRSRDSSRSSSFGPRLRASGVPDCRIRSAPRETRWPACGSIAATARSRSSGRNDCSASETEMTMKSGPNSRYMPYGMVSMPPTGDSVPMAYRGSCNGSVMIILRVHVFRKPVGRKLAPDTELKRLLVHERAHRRELIAKSHIVEEARDLLRRRAALGATENEIVQVRQLMLLERGPHGLAHILGLFRMRDTAA